MPSLAPYIPPKNANLIAWLANFSTLITASPGTYGLASGDATTIAGINTAMSSGYTLITSPATKTATTVAAFNALKAGDMPTIRQYSQMIANNPGVSSSNKVALGLNPKTSTPVPITTPTTSPALTNVSTSQAGTILRFRDATASPSVKAKPYGVIGMQLFATGSTTPITDPALLPYVAVVTKSPIQVTLGSAFAGMHGYFAARWVTRKGLVGPWSNVLNVIVAG